MTDAQKAELFFDLHRCPTTRRVLDSGKSDDKALCGCGQPNPRLVEMGHSEAPGTHLKRFLETASGTEYIAQRRAAS